jgi:hypothetical protein
MIATKPVRREKIKRAESEGLSRFELLISQWLAIQQIFRCVRESLLLYGPSVEAIGKLIAITGKVFSGTPSGRADAKLRHPGFYTGRGDGKL